MKSSKPLPAKRTINSHTGSNKQQPKQQKESPNANSNTNNNNTDPICDICAQNVPGPEREKIFALGKCDHHVCYVCSARLRAICDQPECPICREKLDFVIFSADKNKPFDRHDTTSYIYTEKYKIYFENETIRDAFDKLLIFECLECVKRSQSSTATKKMSDHIIITKNCEFPDVSKLRNHLNFTHKLRLCDLCLNHNRLFPFEYSYYDNVSLRKHMKEGELNTSHRGHPDCVLCHSTFFNQDELLQHMSREHYHCHLCGRHNDNMHIYFQDYNSLRLHFKAEHFLCERGNCKHEQFTSAFDSQIDYQLHIVNVHGGSANASNREARQQRTITLDSAPHRLPTTRHQASVPPNAAIVSTGTLATANASDPRRQVPESIQMQIRQQRLPSGSDFPALGHVATGSNTTPTSQSVSVSSTSSASQFPSLARHNSDQISRSASLYQRVTAGPSSSRGSFVRSAGGAGRAPDQLNAMDFPPLPEQPKLGKTKLKQSNALKKDDNLTLDQLISSSLMLSARNNKNKPNQSNRSTKQKALKIQL